MRNVLIGLVCSVCLSACSGSGETPDSADLTQENLIGTWDVALYFDPTQPPSSTELVIAAVADGQLSGTFYQSPFEASGVTAFEDEILFTVKTSDNSGPYLTSGRLKGDCIDGQTLSTGRGFLMAWKACPKESEDE